MEELEKNETSTQAEESTVSLASAQALADALAKIEAYTPTTWVDNSSPDIDAEHLNKPEQAIKRVTDALNSAVDVIKDLQSQVTKNAGDISTVNSNLSNSQNDITQLYSDKGKAIYSPDLFGKYDSPTFVFWNGSTANCPYKAGLTQGQEGFAIIYGDKSGWHTVLAWQKGGSTSNGGWKHTFEGGTNVGWVEYVTAESLNKKTFSAYFSTVIDTDTEITKHGMEAYWTLTFSANDSTGKVVTLTDIHLFTVVHITLGDYAAIEHAYDTTGKLIAYRYFRWWAKAWTEWVKA